VRFLIVALIACNAAPPPPPRPGSVDQLAEYLRTVAGADQATREREVATWLMPEATWNKTIILPWRSLYAEYAAHFAARAEATIAPLGSLDPVTTRRHWAGDRRLTLGEARLRWALPVQYPSMVAELGGRTLDAVFIYDYDNGHWRALLGLDELVLDRVRALDPDCAAKLVLAGPLGHCTEIGYVVAAAALRGDGPDLARACRMAATMCGNPAP
jgi:hypothetical protein